MYFFERAYTDFADRFKAVIRVLKRAPGQLWEWFWEGPGATAMEWMLRLAVVVSGFVFAIMYMHFESSQGRGFGLVTVFAFLVIAGYVALLMWGWKTPVHVGARASSGASVVALTILFSMTVVIGGGTLFTAYLIGLFALTALSLLVFGPVRLYLMFYMWRKNLSYACPCDVCPPNSRKLPNYQCPRCGHQYSDLRPSFYGVFHHRCYHPDGTFHKLPTLDSLGRKDLPQFCPTSNQPMIYGKYGLIRRFPIIVVGATKAGKTVFCAHAIRDLTGRINQLDDRAAFMEPEQQLLAMLNMLARGETPDATVGDSFSSIGVAVLGKNARKKSKLLVEMFDLPGEVFESMERFAQKQVMQRAGGIVLMIDPFALPRLDQQARQAGMDTSTAQITMEKTVQNLVQLMGAMRDPNADNKFDIPVAVVISKADELPVRDYTYLANLYPRAGQIVPDTAALSARCRNALVNLGGGSQVRALEAAFSNLQFFACSPLGRRPDGRNRNPFVPAGVIEPFLWMLRDDKMLEGAVAPAQPPTPVLSTQPVPS